MLRSFFAVILGAFVTIIPFGPQIAIPPAHPRSSSITDNSFAFDLLHAVLEQDRQHRNMLIAPMSVYLTMSALCNGAGHATRDSLALALHVEDMDITRLNTLSRDLLQHLPLEDEKVQVACANSVWCNRRKFVPSSSFGDILETYYYAPVQSVNFNVPAATTDINRWVARNTHSMIPSIVDHLDPSDQMELIDAVCFNGDWQMPFGDTTTHDEAFHLASGGIKKVPFMQQEFTAPVFADTSFTMVELPYGNGKGYSMYVILPDDQQQPVREFAATFNQEKLSYALSRMNIRNLSLHIPGWEYAYSIEDLRPALSSLGMGIAFDKENADFCNLCEDSRKKPVVSRVIHKTYIKVNENGTRAAVTTAGMVQSFGSHYSAHRPMYIIADHPFLYLIREKQRNILLFAGIVEDPGQAQ